MKLFFTLFATIIFLGASSQNIEYPIYFMSATNRVTDASVYKISLHEPDQVQTLDEYSWIESHAPVMTIFFVSGLINGMREASSFHWEAFQQTFPDANPEWWNDDISWVNKYEDGDVSKGPDFPGSTTIFVFTTDAYHALTTSDRLCLVVGSGLNTYVNVINGRDFKHYLFDAGINFLVRSVAFHGVYTILIR